MKPLVIILFGIGLMLIWAGLVNRNPIDEAKSVLTTGKLTVK